MTEHSRFGGSSASRWLNCPGSVALLETVPAKPSSVYAEEGTLAHAFAAYMLANGDGDASSYIGSTLDATVGAKPLTEEMAIAIQVYLNAVWAEYDLHEGAELHVEKSFVLQVASAEIDEVFGTNDALVYHPSIGRLRIFDYKHGAGVSVTADENPQLKFYAAGAVFSHEDWKLSEVVLTIVQPRARDVDELGAVRDWPMDTLDLLEFKAECETAIEKAKRHKNILKASGPGWKIDGSFEIGPWCRWCDAAPFCPAKQAEATAPFGDVNLELPPPDLPHPDTLLDERLAAIVEYLSYLTSYANQCQEYLEARLLGGHDVPGWKVVEKIGRAKWISDEEVIADTLGALYGIDENLIRPRRLATITEAEKLMKGAGATKAEIDSFKLANTLKESSGLTVAPEKDRRPAVNTVERAFGDIDTTVFTGT